MLIKLVVPKYSFKKQKNKEYMTIEDLLDVNKIST